MKRIATIVIGSNSTRMLAADACMELTNEIRERVETRLFLGMTNDGLLEENAVSRTVQAVCDLKQKALDAGAELIGIYATSASRDAKNAHILSQCIENTCGMPLEIISGHEEAAYSFMGASGGRRCGVIDIGGGSTEIVLGQGLQLDHAHSLQLGASRLFKTHPINSVSDVPAALESAAQCVRSLPEELLQHATYDDFFLIGGTCTSLAALAGEDAEGFTVSRQTVYDTLLRIAAVPRDKRADIPRFPPTRSDILPTGLVILTAVMHALGIEKACVSKRVNADGILRACVHKKFA